MWQFETYEGLFRWLRTKIVAYMILMACVWGERFCEKAQENITQSTTICECGWQIAEELDFK